MAAKPPHDFSNKHVEILLELGLSKIQAVLYLTSLRHGVLSVLELSKLTKINRQQIYEEAQKLVDLGLYEVTRKQRRKYIAADPDRLDKVGRRQIERTEATLEKLSRMLPILEALALPKKSNVLVKYYEGMDKIREAYESELEACKNMEVLSLAGSVDDIFRFFPESYWENWNKQLVKQKSSSRMLVHASEAARKTASHDGDYGRETRYLHQFPLKVNIDVFGNTVLIVSFYDELALWIESGIVAQSYRILFDTLWPVAKSFEK
jgi:sugar-specific transcriptional regulator TrmB